MKRTKNWIVWLLTAALCLGLLAAPARAETICFVALNDNIPPISGDTIPIWSGGVLYVPYTIFDRTLVNNVDLGVYVSRSSTSVTLWNMRQILVFDLVTGACWDDISGEVFDYARAIVRNGRPYVPLQMVCETRQGLSYARNCGIEASSAPYIAIIDDDETVNPDFVRAYIDFFDSHPDAVAAGGRIVPAYEADPPKWISPYAERPIANPLDLGESVRPFPKDRCPGGGNMGVRRSAIERYGAFDPALGRVGQKLIGGEETDFFERLSRSGEPFYARR